MAEQSREWTDEDIKRWRLDFIKQRHREIILAPRGDDLHEEIIEANDTLPELDEADELESLGMRQGFEFETGH